MRLNQILAFPTLFVVAAFAQDTAPTVDEIIQKSIEARGGLEKIRAIKTSRLTGKMVMMGGQMEAPFIMEVKRPSYVHMNLDIQGKHLVRAFDGTTAWTINPFQGDDASKLSDAETRDMADSADVDGPLVDYKAKGHTVELMGKEDVNGSPAYKLKINKKSGKTDYNYIDAKTYLPVKSVIKATVQGSEMEVESYPTNYKPLNGVMIPYAIEQKMNGQSMMQMTVDKADQNVAIDDSIFKMPAKAEKKEVNEKKEVK